MTHVDNIQVNRSERMLVRSTDLRGTKTRCRITRAGAVHSVYQQNRRRIIIQIPAAGTPSRVIVSTANTEIAATAAAATAAAQ